MVHSSDITNAWLTWHKNKANYEVELSAMAQAQALAKAERKAMQWRLVAYGLAIVCLWLGAIVVVVTRG